MEEEKKENNDDKNDIKENKKKKKFSFRTLFGILIIVAGLGVAIYPLCVQGINKYRQNKMLEEFYKEIELNKQNQKAPVSVTPKPEVTTGNPTEPENSLPGEENTDDREISNNTDDLTEEKQEDITLTPEPTEKPNNNRLNGQTIVGIIEIDAIDLIYPIVEGSDKAEIGVAIGHMTGTANIGEIGNCALAGHRGGYSGSYFKNLNKLKKGDSIRLTDVYGNEFTYLMTESMIVEPTDVWVIEDTGENKAILTLITCENDGNQRLIIRACLEEN